VRPSSSTSESSPLGLFDGVLARGGVREAVGDIAWLQAMLDVEAALARAEARAGILTDEDAEAIAGACRAGDYDIAAIGRDAAASGNPVIPLVRALSDAVGGSAAGHVHHGATSQDIIDTAAMLVAKRALVPLLEDLAAASDASATLVEAHRHTLMAGRTLLQQALPTTFGLKAAGWMLGLDGTREGLTGLRRDGLYVQLGGAAGTLASLGADGIVVLGHLAEELDLREPPIAWHTDRKSIAELAGALGSAAGAVAKPARDVVLLAQTEVGEVHEGTPGSGGSSTLPQKQNPIAAVSAAACAQQAPALVASLMGSMAHEHERAAGAWHAEWRPFTELLRTVGSAASWLRECLGNLQVDASRMRANVDLMGGLLLAERVTTTLTPILGRLVTHDLVERAAQEASAGGRPFAQVLIGAPEIAAHLGPQDVAQLLDPARYLGSTDALVERALQAHRDLPGASVT
jgi:3-carboxy-cis,cis-muconate cycloisomerase